MKVKSKISQQYDRLAPIYDHRWHSYITNSLTFLGHYLENQGEITGITEQETILDVGCGTGELERLLVANYPNLKIVGVDISENMLEVARLKFSNYPGVKFLQVEAIALPFSDHSFDKVITASAFHYFEQPTASLGEIHRVLKPTGSIIVMDWCRDFWYCKILDQILKLIDPAYKTCYTQQELKDILGQTGFKVQDSQRFRLPPLWGMMVVKAISNW